MWDYCFCILRDIPLTRKRDTLLFVIGSSELRRNTMYYQLAIKSTVCWIKDRIVIILMNWLPSQGL